MAGSTRDPVQEYIYFMGSETNLIYPFILRVTGITKKNAIVEYLDYQIPVTKLKGPKGNGNMQTVKRDLSAPPTGGRPI